MRQSGLSVTCSVDKGPRKDSLYLGSFQGMRAVAMLTTWRYGSSREPAEFISVCLNRRDMARMIWALCKLLVGIRL